MKKILLILALLSLGVSKAQVVGGYLPLNSSKSATMGGLRVNGTSTFTGNALFSSSVGVGGLPTSSLSSFQLVKGTGSLNIGSSDGSGVTMWGNVTPSTSNYLIYSNGASSIMNGTTTARLSVSGNEKVYCTSTGVKINSSSTPNSALDVNGSIIASGTFSLGSANLTGGNTGTVAVLSDALFTTTHFHGLATVGTSVFYYDKYNSSSGSSSSSGAVGLTYIPFNCTLVGYSLFNGVLGTLGSSSATVAVRVNNTTDVVLNSAVQYTASAQSYSSAALSTTIAAGDYIEIKVTPNNTPTAATNAIQQITLFFARRQ